MLSTAIFLFNSSSSGGGVYTIDAFFSPSAMAKYLRIGDTLEDSVGNRYKVTTWTGYSSDNSDGNTVTTTYIDTDTLPIDSTAIYDGFAYTPDQLDIQPRVHTDGSISSASVFAGKDFEYTITGGWASSAEANKAVAGDYVIDKTGKAYRITFIDGGSRFSVPFRVTEQEAEGAIPPDGSATLYSPTRNIDLFQGTWINTLAETSIRNRDSFLLDEVTDFLEPYTNVEGSTIERAQIVFESSTGDVELARADDAIKPGTTVGIVYDRNIANAAAGNVLVKTGFKMNGFSGLSTGEPVYVSRTVAGSVQQNTSGFIAGEHIYYLGRALSSTELLYDPRYGVEY